MMRLLKILIFTSIIMVLALLQTNIIYATNQEEVSVDLSSDLRQPVYQSCGVLHGWYWDGENVPDWIVSPWNISWQRFQEYTKPTRPTLPPYDFGTAQKGKRMGANTECIVHNFSVFNESLNDYESLNDAIGILVNDAKSEKLLCYWDLYNEPESFPLSDNIPPSAINTQTFRDCWALEYDAVRAADPNAIIIGPSAASINYTNFYDAMEDFLVWAQTANKLPNYLTWHFTDDPVVDAQTFRSMLSEHNISNVGLLMNEYLQQGQLLPCCDAWYLCRNERADIDANLAIWVGDGLGGTIWKDTSGNWVTRGRWWVYKRYSEITGMLVNTTASTASEQNVPRVEILAGKDPEKGTVKAIMGSNNNVNWEDVTVVFKNLSSTPYVIDNNTVNVIVEKIPNDNTVYTPTVIVNQNCTVVNNQINLNTGWGNSENAYAITLRKPTNISVKKDTLICDYSFEEASGSTINDGSDYTNNGTINGTVNRVTGQSGNAISLNGNSYITVTNSSSFGKIDDELLLDFWIYPTTSGAFQRVIDKTNTTQSGFELQMTPGNCINFGVGNQGITTTESIPVNQWTHIKASYKANNKMEIYYNNILKAQAVTGLFCIPNNNLRLTIGADVDSNYKFTGLLDEIKIKSSVDDIVKLSFEESDGATIIDETGDKNDGTVSGTANRIEVDAHKGKSMFLNGSSYITIPDSDSLDSIKDSLCIDMWVYPTVSGVWQRIIDKADGSTDAYTLQIDLDNTVNFAVGNQSVTTLEKVTPYKWNRIKATYKRNGKIRVYINDDLKAEAVAADLDVPQNNLRLTIGADINGNNKFTGYFDDININNYVTDSNAKYSFEEQSGNSIIDVSGSGNSGRITGNVNRVSGYSGNAIALDGNSYLTVPDSSELDSLSSEMTLDFWIYPTTTGTWRRVIDKINSTNNGFYIQVDTDNTLNFGVGDQSVTTIETISLNQWSHVKATYRKNDKMRIYINGEIKAEASTTDTYIKENDLRLTVGADVSGNFKFIGYLDEINILDEVKDNISAYTFQESGGSAISDTSGNSNNGYITGIVSRTDGVTGNAISLDGNSYITVPDSSSLDSLKGELTIDFWINPSSSGTWRRIIDKLDANQCAFLIQLSPTNYITFGVGSQSVTSASALSSNQWTHIRATYRKDDKIRIYINGVLNAEAVTANTNITNNNLNLTIGADISGNFKFSGLLDDITIKDIVEDEICELSFNEPRGSKVKDGSVYLNDGIVAPGIADRVAGINGKTVSFDGSIYVKVPQDSCFSNIKDELKIDFWFKPAVTNTWQRIIDKTDSSQNAFLVQMTPNGTINFAVGSQSVTTTSSIQANQWSKITVTYKRNDKIRIYINSALSAEANATDTDVPANDLWMTIGADANGNYKVNGHIDEVRITNSLKSIY